MVSLLLNSIKYYVMKKNHIVLLFILLFLLFIVFNIILILPKMLSQNQSYNISTQAIENECSYCLNEPPCCAKMVQNSDMHECDWPIRGYCQLNTCHSVDVPKQERCGWYWIWHDANDNDAHLGNNTPNGYGCMIGNSESTLQPRCTPQGEVTLSPTIAPAEPTIPEQPPQVTETPAPEPTIAAVPTTILRVPPNEIPTHAIIPNAFQQSTTTSVSQPFEFPSIHLPTINFPKVNIDLVAINQNARKPLDLFEYLFRRIVYYDSLLEKNINGQLIRILK